MNYEQAETDIYNRLAPFQGADIEVVKLPENQTDFKRPFAKGKYTVSYKSSKWKNPQSTFEISQEEELTFEIAIQARTLRGAKGVYNLLKVLKAALIGFRPAHCEKMYAVESGMTGVSETLNDGVWTYVALFACKSLTVEDFEEDLSVILTQVTTNRENPDGTATGDQIVVTKSDPDEVIP